MKKLLLPAILASTMFLGACGGDDAPITPTTYFTYTNIDADSVVGRSTDADLEIHAVIVNPTNQEQSYTWVRSNVTQPSAWTNAICDPVQCWSPNVSTKDFTLPANSQDTFVIHFYPGGAIGRANLDLTLTKTGDASTAQTFTYKGIAE